MEMADACGIDQKRFRQTLRDAKLPWHAHGTPWVVKVGSSQHEDMRKVLQGLTGNSVRVARSSRFTVAVSRRRNDSDESYVIELCNELLRQQARSEEHTSELQSLMRISYAD